MTRLPRVCAGLMLGLGSLVAAQAPVPVSEEPRHRVVIETPAFRILDVAVPPGETTLEHVHRHDVVTIAMSEGAETRTQSPGEAWSAVRPRRSIGHANVTEYAGRPGTHRIQNVGTVPYLLFAVENLRDTGWSTSPPLTHRDVTLAAESRSFRVYDIALGQNEFQTSHVHSVPALAVLVGGRVISQGGDAPKDAVPPLPAGLKQLDQPGQWIWIPAGEPHYLVRLAPDAARLVEIEIR